MANQESKIRNIFNLIWEPVDFSSKIKRNRLTAFDLHRGFFLLVMVIWNITIFLGNRETRNDSIFTVLIENVFWVEGTFAIYAIMPGIYLVYSQPSTKHLLFRAVYLFALGTLLNILQVFPLVLGILTGRYGEEVIHPFRSLGELASMVGIFQFAGLFFVAFAVLRKVMGPTVRPLYWLLLALLVIQVSPYLTGQMTGLAFIDWFLPFLWGSGFFVVWPFFPMFGYVLLGIFFGSILIKFKELNNLDKSIVKAGVPVLLLGILLVDVLNKPFHQLIPDSSFAGAGLEVFIKATGVLMCSQALFVWLEKTIRPNNIFNLLMYWNRNIANVFFWSCMVMGVFVSFYFQGFREGNPSEITVILIITLIATHFILKLSNATTKKIRKLSVNR